MVALSVYAVGYQKWCAYIGEKQVRSRDPSIYVYTCKMLHAFRAAQNARNTRLPVQKEPSDA